MADNPVKVRIGVSLGAAGVPAQFSAAVDALEAAGVDSLWLPEMVYGSLVDPFIGMAHALARTSRLKVGTGVAVLPGRHPVLVAKQLATLAGLSPRRVLPVFGLKPARPAELAAFPVPPGRRGRGVRRHEGSANMTGTACLSASRPCAGRPFPYPTGCPLPDRRPTPRQSRATACVPQAGRIIWTPGVSMLSRLSRSAGAR
jgi:alkanesulfonate monooxygenase SsuD/methylene tetrahydromethanopterin reductase-like flavin-dependent oxidoreductase (luciferase family)